jgi:predicted adenine nucleotide alpha hydrolase (AANH) superfamily ATPase
MTKLLLHTCCGPCFLGVWQDLAPKDFEVVNLFYNPNVQPEFEYQKRLDNLKKAARKRSRDILTSDYDKEEHEKAIARLEQNFPERCLKCYRLRLERAAQEAISNDFDLFSITLLTSPYQQHEDLKLIGQRVGDKIGVEFYYQDWRPYFRQGQNLARELNIYRQKFCGCKWSKIEKEEE